MSGTAYLDIETTTDATILWTGLVEAGLVVLDEDLGRALVRPAAREWLEQHAGDRALDPHGGRLVCWAVAWSTDVDFVRSGPDEVDLLAGLLNLLRDQDPGRIVAHGGRDFDFPFLRARALARGLPELAQRLWTSKPWDSYLVDTTDPDWFPRPPKRIPKADGWTFRLDHVAELLGVTRPVTIPGAQVPAAWYLGRAEEVQAHCLDDARTLRAVTRRLAEGRGE